MNMLSVTSSSSRCGASPLPRNASSTVSRRPVAVSCATDTLTATRRSAGQAAAWRHASRTTQPPIWWISPTSSMIGMNTSGEIDPRWGCDQRNSASWPTTSIEAALRIG